MDGTNGPSAGPTKITIGPPKHAGGLPLVMDHEDVL